MAFKHALVHSQYRQHLLACTARVLIKMLAPELQYMPSNRGHIGSIANGIYHMPSDCLIMGIF